MKQQYRDAIDIIAQRYPNKVLLSTEEVAELLGVSTSTIYRSKIKTVKLGKEKKYSIMEVANYICGSN